MTRGQMVAVAIGAVYLLTRKNAQENNFQSGSGFFGDPGPGFLAASAPNAGTAAQVANGSGTASPAFTQMGYFNYDGTTAIIQPDYINRRSIDIWSV